MGAPRKADWREERRKRAWDLKEQGWQQKDIAVALGVGHERRSSESMAPAEGENKEWKPSPLIRPKE